MTDLGVKFPKKYIDRVRELCESSELVEIVSRDYKLTGHLTEVGDDYIGISFAVEQEITKQVPADGAVDDAVKSSKFIEVLELETFLMFKQIDSISRIKKKTTK